MRDTNRPTKSEIFTAYNKLRAMARKENDQKLMQRVNKALGILLSNDYYQNDKAEYKPTVYRCNCKDWEFRFAHKRGYTGMCKHMLAEWMLKEIEFSRSMTTISK